MWFEENDQFVRAPTPEGFERLVKKLEDGDSVLFESISLPSLKPESLAKVKPSQKSSPKRATVAQSQDIPREVIASMQVPSLDVDDALQKDDMDLSDDFIEDEDSVEVLGNDPKVLKDKLVQLELEGQRKSDAIKAKDQQILVLTRELNELQAKRTGQAAKPVKTAHESVEFYKAKYEKALMDLDILKQSLRESGKLRKVSARSARAIKPQLEA